MSRSLSTEEEERKELNEISSEETTEVPDPVGGTNKPKDHKTLLEAEDHFAEGRIIGHHGGETTPRGRDHIAIEGFHEVCRKGSHTVADKSSGNKGTATHQVEGVPGPNIDDPITFRKLP